MTEIRNVKRVTAAWTNDIAPRLQAANRHEWRRWLEKHHRTEKAVWLVLSKKGAVVPSVTYDEAVEEAICFGWIDGMARSIDVSTYAQRFTPRRPNSNWSAPNLSRARKMIEAGKMTAAGLAKLGDKRL